MFHMLQKHIPTYLSVTISGSKRITVQQTNISHQRGKRKIIDYMLIPTRVSMHLLYTHMHVHRDSSYHSYPKHMKIQIKFLAFAGGQRYIHEISWGLTLSSGGLSTTVFLQFMVSKEAQDHTGFAGVTRFSTT